jgi:hypothetical protein
VAGALEQAASVGEVRCEQAALTGAVLSQETALRIPGLSRESRIQSQIDPTSAGLAGLMSDCLADQATDLAGVAVGAEIIGRDMVGVQRQ